MAWDDGSSAFPLSLGLDQPPVYGAPPAPTPAPQAQPPQGPMAPGQSYSALINSLAARANAPGKAIYTPEEIAQRKADNATQYQLGILGQLSGDSALSDVGGLVFKQALAQRTPTVTEKGSADPLTGEFTPNAAYQQEKTQAELDKVTQAQAAAVQQDYENRQHAADQKFLAQQAQASAQLIAGMAGAQRGAALQDRQDNLNAKLELDMQGRFASDTKPYQLAYDASGNLLDLLNTATPNKPLTSTSQVAAVDFMNQIMNPHSIVRDASVQRLVDAQGLTGRMGNLYNSVMLGQPLTTQQLTDMGNLAQIYRGSALSKLQSTATNYVGVAQNRKLNPANVIINPAYRPDPALAQGGGATASPAAPATPGAGGGAISLDAWLKSKGH